MVERSSIRVLLALVAALGIALGAACNKDVRAYERDDSQIDQPKTGESEPTHNPPSRIGGGPTQAHPQESDGGREDRLEGPNGPIEENSEELDDDGEELLRDKAGEDHRVVPDSREALGEDDASEKTPQGGPTEGPGGDDAREESEDNESNDDNWHVPIRGSGGDTPPDFIETAEPQLA